MTEQMEAYREKSNLEQKIMPDYVGKGKFIENMSSNQMYPMIKKYLLRDEDGRVVENPPQAVYRMARTIAEVEMGYGKSNAEVEKLTREFYEIIAEGFFSPAGRIWTNAGTNIRGLFNCYVLPIQDDLSEIYDSVKNAAIIHKNGGGTGYNFSGLRPRGTFVQKSKGIASGPVSFIGQFDKETEIINSGNRRGANMGIVDVTHPDILDFIYAKAQTGEIKNFNVSIGATNNFMKSVEEKGFYNLEFPEGNPFNYGLLESIVRNIEENKVGGADVGKLPKPASMRFDSKEIIPGKSLVIDTQTRKIISDKNALSNDEILFEEQENDKKINVAYKIAGRVNEEGIVQLYAPYLLDVIANLAWKTGDPGMIFLDEINKHNPLPNLGRIKATNPCGEQPLHPYDACNLGSHVLSNFVVEGGNGIKHSSVNYEKLNEVVHTATRFMDNVNDANEGPIPQVKETTMMHRRIGMGVMGFADMLIKMGIPYDSEGGRNLARKVMGTITDESKKASVEIAKEKGVFGLFDGSIYDNGNPDDRVRNVDRTTIAPTGTISMLYDCSGGIEPIFAIVYEKHIRGGDRLKYLHPLFLKECEKRGIDHEILLPLIEKNHGSVQGLKEVPEDMQKVFKTAHDLNYKDHILMQAAFQEFTDNAVSKTINMRKEATVEDIKDAYFFAWKNNLKGITVYRDGSKEIQVLTTVHGNNLEKKVISAENPLKVPGIMPAIKIRQSTHEGNIHGQVVVDPRENYSPLEIFAELGNAGTQEAATMEALGRLGSYILRTGGKIDPIIAQLKDIGSGINVVTRDGGIQSLPMGYARMLMKFQVLKEKYNMEDFFAGKLDYDKIEEEISDILRTGKENEFDKNALPEEVRKGKAVGQMCPECHEKTLIRTEGCNKCINDTCGFSKC